MDKKDPGFAEVEVFELARNPRAMTFVDIADEGQSTVEVLILSGPSSTGLCKVQRVDGNTRGADATKPFVRHVSKLTPANDAARSLLGKS